MEKNPKLSSSVAAILTALNIADVFFECSDSNDELVKENEDLKKKVGTNNGELKIYQELFDGTVIYFTTSTGS